MISPGKSLFPKDSVSSSPREHTDPSHPSLTHPQLRKPWWLLGRLLVGSVCQGGNDALAMAEQVHLQDLGSEEGSGQWQMGSRAPHDWASLGRGRTHIDKLQLPEVLHSVDGAVAAGQEGVHVVLQPQGVQPGGHRQGAAPVAAQGLHLWGKGDKQADICTLTTWGSGSRPAHMATSWGGAPQQP